MKKGLFILLVVLAGYSQHLKAQYYLTNEGRPIRQYITDLGNVDGTIFLNKEWALSSITSARDTIYKNVRLKYDVYHDKPLFALAGDEMMEFKEPIKEFTINEMLFANGFPVVDTLGRQSYYQVLGSGKTKLLKHLCKRIQESKGYNSPPSLRFIDSEGWYLFKDGQMIAVKPDKKAILTALGNKTNELNEYLSSHKVNFKKDTDLETFIAYYNRL